MSAAGRCAARTPKGAASPPLTFDKAAAPGLGDAPREGTGPPLRPPGCCALPAATALRTGLDPGDHCGPSARRYGQVPACPAPWRGASGDPHAHGTYDGRKDTQLNWRSILARSGKITRIRYEEVSTLSGDCRLSIGLRRGYDFSLDGGRFSGGCRRGGGRGGCVTAQAQSARQFPSKHGRCDLSYLSSLRDSCHVTPGAQAMVTASLFMIMTGSGAVLTARLYRSRRGRML